MPPLPPLTDDSFEQQLKRDSPVIWALTLFGPFVLSILILLGLYVFYDHVFTTRLVGTIFITFFFFGRFIILGGNDPEMSEIQQFFSPEFLFGMVFYMDMVMATLFVFHAGFLFKIPWIGRRLGAIAEDGHFILKKNPWINRAAFLGLVAFVAFPLAATGSVGGAILSRILGMSKTQAYLAIIIGSITGSGMMYFGAHMIDRYFSRDNPVTTYGGIGLVVVIIVALNLWYRRLKGQERKGLERHEP